MIGRIVFLSAVAFAAYKYINRNNQKVKQELASAARGTVEILPPDKSAKVIPSNATETLRAPRIPLGARQLTGRPSAATEDLSNRY